MTVYIERAVLDQAAGGEVSFHFGLLGRCTAVVDPPDGPADARA